MSVGLVADLRARVSGRVLADEPLGERTTLRVGGPAAALTTVEDVSDLIAVAEVCAAHSVPWLVLGRGSNLLVADAGWPGVVVELGRGFRGVEVGVDGEPGGVVAGAAEPMPVLARRVEREGLGGLAFGVAIPGSLGGAVRMNAGAHGGEMADVLRWAEVVRLARGGSVERWDLERLGPSYRHTELPADAVVVRARLDLVPTDPEQLAADMAEMKRWRRETQPINEPSCGSVFRNPPGDAAGRLIEAAGCKGYRVGGAAVSAKHANFITVSPAATAADVLAVITHVRDRVEHVHGVALRPEVVMVGFEETACQ
ncbi:MAG: UDP-N-acetylmuramate dehydrogenase [Actinobacteria bacterium]|nr:UDP-N-acetylmuramate dehydrogenase [Actinomycetota bacterium]